jgi:thiol:disulfide interchange protein
MKITKHNLLLSLTLMFAWITATAESDFLTKPSDSSWANEIASPEFVPVEQAYSLEVVAEDQRLLLNWTIRDGYYLYRDRFKFGSVDTSAVLAAPIFASGLVKWDDYFEKEVEVYYQHTSVELPFTSTADRLSLQIESQGCADAGLCYPPYKQWLNIDLASGIVEISTQPPNTAEATGTGATFCPSRWHDSQSDALCVSNTVDQGVEFHHEPQDRSQQTYSRTGLHCRRCIELCGDRRCHAVIARGR